MKSAFKKLPANKHSLDFGLIFTVTLCAVLGVLLIFSIARSEVSADEGIGDSYWKTQLFSMGLGLTASIIISHIEKRLSSGNLFFYYFCSPNSQVYGKLSTG